MTDGSYVRHLASNVNGAGWIISTRQADGQESQRAVGKMVQLDRELQRRDARDASSQGVPASSREIFPTARQGRRRQLGFVRQQRGADDV